jgi:hypothetical protein
MASTYSPSLRIQLIETGTENEAWGQPLDNNLGTIIEQAIVGSNTISLTNLTSYTLTAGNAVTDQARNAVLVFDGALSANCNVIAPSVQKVYVISNQTTGNKVVSVRTSSGNAVSLANGTNQLVYCDGTDFISAVNINNIVGDFFVSGNVSVAGNVSVTTNTYTNNKISVINNNLTLTSNTSVVSFQNNTRAMVPPYGTTAERPASPALGMSRWNTTLGWYEIWNGFIWQQITGSFAVSYLLVAGGAGGGNIRGGGGGAGGMLTGSFSTNAGVSYAITVGSGGGSAANGSASSIGTVASAIGGGFGGSGNGTAGPYFGGNGGSGGGAPSAEGGGLPDSKPGGSGTAGQGNNGGSNNTQNNSNGGGGGGAGAAGANNPSGIGGAGAANSLRTDSPINYAGGGGAGGSNDPDSGPQPGSAGGIGGGGNGGQGGTESPTNGVAGTANTGGGGGGGGGTLGTPRSGGAGGSGIVVIRYANLTQRATGGTVTTYTSGGTTYWIHTFTTSGIFAT